MAIFPKAIGNSQNFRLSSSRAVASVEVIALEETSRYGFPLFLELPGISLTESTDESESELSDDDAASLDEGAAQSSTRIFFFFGLPLGAAFLSLEFLPKADDDCGQMSDI